MISFHFNRENEPRNSIKAQNIEHLRDLLKCTAFRHGYRFVGDYDTWCGCFYKAYGKTADGTVNFDDHIGNLYFGDID